MEKEMTGKRFAVFGVALVLALGLFAQLVWALPTEARAAVGETIVYLNGDEGNDASSAPTNPEKPVRTFAMAVAVLKAANAAGGTIVAQAGGQDGGAGTITIPENLRVASWTMLDAAGNDVSGNKKVVCKVKVK